MEVTRNSESADVETANRRSYLSSSCVRVVALLSQSFPKMPYFGAFVTNCFPHWTTSPRMSRIATKPTFLLGSGLGKQLVGYDGCSWTEVGSFTVGKDTGTLLRHV